nr:palindromic element RPE1 domain-containing protein [Rickettsia helvetica]
MHNLSYKEEFEGNTARRTAAYKKVRRICEYWIDV